MRSRFIWVILLLLPLPFLIPFFRAGYFATDDGMWAIVRQASMHAELRQGQFPVRWSGNLNFGYGYPLFEFSYPGPYYIGELFHIIGFNFVDTVKALFVAGTIGSVVAMYFFVRELWKNEMAGVIGAVVYLAEPYRFVNLYVRGSIGETLSNVLYPLLCLLGLKLLQTGKRRYLLGGSFSLALLIIMHNVMALIFVPFFVYFLVSEIFIRNIKFSKLIHDYIDEWKNRKNSYKQEYTLSLFYKHIFPVGMMLVIGIALSASFWLPALSELKYVRLGTIPLTSVEHEFNKQKGLLLSPLDSHPTQTDKEQVFEENLEFEYIILAFAAIAVVLFHKNKYELVLHRIVLYSIPLLIGLVLLTPVSIVAWKFLPGLKSIDFPWRVLSLMSFISPIIIASSALIPRIKYIGIVVAVISLFLIIPLAGPSHYLSYPEEYYATNQATTTSANEYISKWMKTIPTERAEADPRYKTVLNASTHKRYEYNATTSAELVFPVMYFPGWQLYLDGQKKAFEYISANGLVKSTIPAGEHSIELIFSRTAARTTGDLITLASIIGIGVLGAVEYARGKRFIL